MDDIKQKKYIVAITGASGSIYGIRLVKALMQMPVTVYLVMSKSGKQVMVHETGNDASGFDSNGSFIEFLKNNDAKFHEQATLTEVSSGDFFSPAASGSFQHDGMVIAPCSMNTLGSIASGITNNIIHRAADVCLKEKRSLILLPRETPLSLIHLKNMKNAAKSGAVIMPPSPGFYNHPKTIDDLVDSIVARVLDHLGIDHDLSERWGG